MPFTVAIIDDEEKIRSPSKRVLVKAYGNYVTVYEASTVVGGQQLVKAHHPDIILLDGSIHSNQEWNSQPVITTVQEEQAADPDYHCTMIATSSRANQQMIDAGCDRSLPKPYSFQDLIAVIASVRPR